MRKRLDICRKEGARHKEEVQKAARTVETKDDENVVRGGKAMAEEELWNQVQEEAKKK